MVTKYLTTSEAAERLKVSERRVRQFCESGRLGRKFGRNYAITEAQCDAFSKKERLTGGAGHGKKRSRNSRK